MSVAQVALSYDSTNLNSANPGESIYFEIKSGLFSGVTTKGTDSSPPSHDGEFARPRRLHRRSIILEGIISGDTPSDYYNNWETVVALFDLKDHGNLVATLPNGAVYTLDCRPVNIIPNELLSDALAFPSIELKSYEDADWEVGT